MATVKELVGHVGRRGVLDTGDLRVVVEVIDVKIAYGGIRLLVSPVCGAGLAWVESYRVVFYDDVLAAPKALQSGLVADID